MQVHAYSRRSHRHKVCTLSLVGSVHACNKAFQWQVGTSLQSYRIASRSNHKLRAATTRITQDSQQPSISAIAFLSKHHQPFKAATQSSGCKPKHGCRTVCQAAKQAAGKQSMEAQTFPEVGKDKTLLIIGGTGRVGASTAAALTATHPNLKIVLGSQNQASYDDAVQNRPELKGLEFKVVNRDDIHSLTQALKECDIVLHTAGPFQRKKECLVLEAAIKTKTPYIGATPVTNLAVCVCVCHNRKLHKWVPSSLCLLLISPDALPSNVCTHLS